MSLRSLLSRARPASSWAPRLAGCLALSLALAGCPVVDGPPPQDPTALKWLTRAKGELQVADIDEARDSIAKALSAAPDDPEARLLAGKVHLALLDYAEALKHLKGLKGSEAAGLRGRAYWYKGDLESAADELDAMLNDPDVVDDWAKSIAKLARRGAGRTPFTISGGLLAAIDMPRVSPTAPFFVVEVDIDSVRSLALVATGSAEVVLDSATRAEPSWVSLGFGDRLQVSDVPALTQDLSGISKLVGAPVKAILGVNLLRHLNVTLDWQGRQFVARSFSPPPPPDATRIPLYYAKGGGMLMKSTLGEKAASLLVDTSSPTPMSLDEGGWKKIGVDVKDLQLVAEDPEKKMKEGTIPLLKLGSSDIQNVPGVFSGQVKAIEDKLSFDIDGMIGNGLLAYYRITLADGGRLMWLEDNLAVQRQLNGGQLPPAPPPAQLTPPNQSNLPDGAPTVISPEPKAPEPPKAPPGKTAPQGGNPGPANPPPKTQNPGASKGP